MKKIIFLCIGLITLNTHLKSINAPFDDRFALRDENTDSLPAVLPKNHTDLIARKLRNEAVLKFEGLQFQLPDNLKDWETYRFLLKNEIIEKAGVDIDHSLPLNIKETGTIQMKGYTVKNIAFQTRPEVYATANLYIPDGKGPFPAVIKMLGHWSKGRLDAPTTVGPQVIGHSLALNGYVCLIIDPWGAGERTTTHGVFEYHGGNLGASLMDIGESLMGMLISDNIRGVDLICSLPYVDSKNIGATGTSGGGNQTMWLAAMDERIKAAIPVISVGTFESYVMRNNCIGETLIDGLTFTEEAGVLALARAIMPFNHLKDPTPSFFPFEMLRSYNNAKKIFKLRGEEDNISYRIFDYPHYGYPEEGRWTMLGWFDFHLKGIGTGAPKKEIPFNQLTEEKLMVFPKGQRDANVLSTAEYCRRRGNELRTVFINTQSFNTDKKKKELQIILRLNEKSDLKKIHQYSSIGGWDRFALETSDGLLLPLLHRAPLNKSLGYVILCNPDGKNSISTSLIDELKKKGSGIVVVDLSGTGELTSTSSLPYDKIFKLHTLSRANLWLGKTVLGEWVKELDLVIQFLRSNYKVQKVNIDGTKEAGLAGLFLSVVEGNVDNITLRDAPISYLFDNRESVDFFSMGIHLPGFLKWGDVSLAAALSGKNITFINPVTMSGQKISGTKLKEFQNEFDKIKVMCKQQGKTLFN
jgi:hypothetical protein